MPLESHTTSTLDREHIAARVDTVIDRDTVTLTVSVAGDTVMQGSHPMARTDPSDCRHSHNPAHRHPLQRNTRHNRKKRRLRHHLAAKEGSLSRHRLCPGICSNPRPAAIHPQTHTQTVGDTALPLYPLYPLSSPLQVTTGNYIVLTGPVVCEDCRSFSCSYGIDTA